MLAAMALFCCGDALMKLAAPTVATGQCLFVRSCVSVAILWALVAYQGEGRDVVRALTRPMGLRVIGDVGGSIFYQSALARVRFADASAVLQINPLMVTAAAALFLGERVGWRRWTATAVGLAGVLLIIQPGTGAFTWSSVLLIVAVMFATLRDLATRRIDQAVPGFVVTALSQTAVLAASASLSLIEPWRMLDRLELAELAVAGVFSLTGQLCLVASIRSGDISAVVPFRYSAILWSLMLGVLLWGELPDALTACGIAIVVGAGLYAFFREQKLARLAHKAAQQS